MRTHIDTGASIAEMESESRPRPTLDLDTDNFQSQETNSTASEHQVSRGMAHSVRATYSTRLALFIHGITSAKRTREVRPAVLHRESSAQLIMYSLDTCVRYSTYIYTDFQVSERLHGGPEFSGNYLIDYVIIT